MKVTNLAKESKSKSKKLYIGKYSVGKILVGLLLVGVFAFFSISVVNQNADISRLEKQKAEIGAKYDAQQTRNFRLCLIMRIKTIISRKKRGKRVTLKVTKSFFTIFHQVSKIHFKGVFLHPYFCYRVRKRLCIY